MATVLDNEGMQKPASLPMADMQPKVINNLMNLIYGNHSQNYIGWNDLLNPLKPKWEYGLLCYDEVHGLPGMSSKTFLQEFQIKQKFTIGFSGTLICNIDHFIFILALCSHTLARVVSAKDLDRKIVSKASVDNPVRKSYHNSILHWMQI